MCVRNVFFIRYCVLEKMKWGFTWEELFQKLVVDALNLFYEIRVSTMTPSSLLFSSTSSRSNYPHKYSPLQIDNWTGSPNFRQK